MKVWVVNYFLISLLASLLFFAGANFFSQKLEQLLYQQELVSLGLTAKIASKVAQSPGEQYKPLRDWQVESMEAGSSTKAALVMFVANDGKKHVLYQKNSQTPLPIASLTKLMTALVARQKYNLTDALEIKTRLPEDNGGLMIGETFEAGDLLHFSLIASNNGAAYALSGPGSQSAILKAMNQKAQELGMLNSRFFNTTGLDPDRADLSANYASATDLAKLALAVNQDPVLREILVLPEAALRAKNTGALYNIKNSNLLVGQPDIRWGKTGFTPRAGGCLLVISQAPAKKGLLIAIVLGSSDRFGEIQSLLDWSKRAYHF